MGEGISQMARAEHPSTSQFEWLESDFDVFSRDQIVLKDSKVTFRIRIELLELEPVMVSRVAK